MRNCRSETGEPQRVAERRGHATKVQQSPMIMAVYPGRRLATIRARRARRDRSRRYQHAVRLGGHCFDDQPSNRHGVERGVSHGEPLRGLARKAYPACTEIESEPLLRAD
jgi:hypothetical protein